MANNFSYNRLQPLYEPVLPIAEREYSAVTQQQRDNILRLWFNRVANVVQNVISENNGATYLFNAHGTFIDTADQIATAVNTPQAVYYSLLHCTTGITLEDGSRLSVDVTGMYSFHLSVQIASASAATKNITFWMVKNGTPMPHTAREYTLDGSGKKAVLHWNFMHTVLADDYLEIMWSVDDTDLHIHYHDAATPHPAVPSVVMSIHHVSNHREHVTETRPRIIATEATGAIGTVTVTTT